MKCVPVSQSLNAHLRVCAAKCYESGFSVRKTQGVRAYKVRAAKLCTDSTLGSMESVKMCFLRI